MKTKKVMSYDPVDIDYQSINRISIGNVVYFQSTIWQIYDIEDDMLYMRSARRENMGVPKSEITPILLTPEIMMLCGFTIAGQESEPQYYIGKDIIQTKTQYVLYKDFPSVTVDMKLNIVMSYKLDKDQYVIDTINKIETSDSNLLYLHQVQNMFKQIYSFELFEIEYDGE